MRCDEYGMTLSLKLNNQTLPKRKHLKIFEITLEPKLTFLQQIILCVKWKDWKDRYWHMLNMQVQNIASPYQANPTFMQSSLHY